MSQSQPLVIARAPAQQGSSAHHLAQRGAFPALAAALIALAAPLAHAVAPNLTTVTPAGGQRGSTVEVTLAGDRLADAEELFFYQPGIKVDYICEAADKKVKAVLTIAPDCPLGEHPLRVRTAGGISALRLFYVGPFPSVDEKEPNNSTARPQPIALNTTVHGTIAAEDIDTFVVEAKKGQRLSVEIEGARLGRTMFDPVVAIHDASGKQLAANDNTTLLGHDSSASVIVPADGRYTVAVRDMVYAGAGHVYRLHVGTFPRPALAYPLGGKAGDTLAVKFLGDLSGDIAQSVTLPAEPVGKFGAVAERDGLAPSPNWLRVSEFPNADADAAPSAPFARHGILATKGKPGEFRFTGKKDQHLEFAVYARRLGSPLDSVLTVLDAKGKSLGSNDDASGNPDSMTRVRLPSDGEYTVRVADQLARGGPLYAYRVEVTEVRPALTLSIPDTARYDYETRKSLVVPRGNRFAVLLNINRDLCNDDLTVAFPGLPVGVTLQADTVPGSLSAVPVVFEAASNAAIAGVLLTPDAYPVDELKRPGVARRYRHNVDWVRIQNDTVYVRSEVGRIAAAVVEEIPFKVRIEQPRAPLVPSGEMALQIVAERRAGFDEPITVKMLWNPPGISSQPDMVIPKGATSIAYKLNATAKADTRAWKIAVIASATVEKGLAHASSQLATLEVAPPFLFGKIALTKVARGQPTRLVCALDQKVPFDGKARATLVGLPANVTAAPVEFTKDDKEAVFTLESSDKSALGLTKNVSCRVDIMQEGEPITHLIALGSVVRVDPAPAKPAAPSAQ